MATPVGVGIIEILPGTSAFLVTLQRKIAPALTQVEKQAATTGNKITSSIAGGLLKAFTPFNIAVVAAGVASLRLASDFDSAMLKIQALVGGTTDEVHSLGDSVLSLATQVPVAPKELADALFFVESAGQRGSQALETLKISAEASAAGLGETKDVADFVTSAMNAYADSNLTAVQATDDLIAAVTAGKLEPIELAKNIGQVLPVAALLKVPLNDVAAGIASVTREGVAANRAATGFRFLFASLLRPTAAAAKALATVGLTAADLQDEIASRGLLPSLQDLADKLDLTTAAGRQAFTAIVGGARGMTVAATLIGQNGEEIEAIFKRVQDSAGDTERAFGISMQSLSNRFKQLVSDLKVGGIQAGDALLPFAKGAVSLADTLLGPVLRNARILLGVFIGYRVLGFLPGLLDLIAAGMVRLSVASAGAEFAAGAEAATGLALALGKVATAAVAVKFAVISTEAILAAAAAAAGIWAGNRFGKPSAAQNLEFLNKTAREQFLLLHGQDVPGGLTQAELRSDAEKRGLTPREDLARFRAEDLAQPAAINASAAAWDRAASSGISYLEALKQITGEANDVRAALLGLPKGFEFPTQISPEAFAKLAQIEPQVKAGLDQLTQTFGVDTSQIQKDYDALFQLNPADVDKFIGGTKNVLAEAQAAWQGAVANISKQLDFLSGNISQFADKQASEISFSAVDAALNKTITQIKDFSAALKDIQRSGPNGKSVAQYFLSLGPSYAGLAEKIASSSGKIETSQVNMWAHVFQVQQSAAQQLAKAFDPAFSRIIYLLKQLVLAAGRNPIQPKVDPSLVNKGLSDMHKNLVDFANGHYDPTLGVNTDPANNKLDSLQSRLRAIAQQKYETLLNINVTTNESPNPPGRSGNNNGDDGHSGGVVGTGGNTIFHSGGLIGWPNRPSNLTQVATKRMHDGGSLAPDEVPAVLQKGEFVVRRQSVKRLGIPFMRAINRMHSGGVADNEMQKSYSGESAEYETAKSAFATPFMRRMHDGGEVDGLNRNKILDAFEKSGLLGAWRNPPKWAVTYVQKRYGPEAAAKFVGLPDRDRQRFTTESFPSDPVALFTKVQDQYGDKLASLLGVKKPTDITIKIGPPGPQGYAAYATGHTIVVNPDSWAQGDYNYHVGLALHELTHSYDWTTSGRNPLPPIWGEGLADFARNTLAPASRVVGGRGSPYSSTIVQYLKHLPPATVRKFAQQAQQGVYNPFLLVPENPEQGARGAVSPVRKLIDQSIQGQDQRQHHPGEEQGARGAVRFTDDDHNDEKKKKPQGFIGQVVKRFGKVEDYPVHRGLARFERSGLLGLHPSPFLVRFVQEKYGPQAAAEFVGAANRDRQRWVPSESPTTVLRSVQAKYGPQLAQLFGVKQPTDITAVQGYIDPSWAGATSGHSITMNSNYWPNFSHGQHISLMLHELTHAYQWGPDSGLGDDPSVPLTFTEGLANYVAHRFNPEDTWFGKRGTPYSKTIVDFLDRIPLNNVVLFAHQAERGIYDPSALIQGQTDSGARGAINPIRKAVDQFIQRPRPGEEKGARGAVRPLDDDDEKKKKKKSQGFIGQVVKRFHGGGPAEVHFPKGVETEKEWKTGDWITPRLLNSLSVKDRYTMMSYFGIQPPGRVGLHARDPDSRLATSLPWVSDRVQDVYGSKLSELLGVAKRTDIHMRFGNVGTAAAWTVGKTITVNPDWWETATQSERKGVLVHELTHAYDWGSPATGDATTRPGLGAINYGGYAHIPVKWVEGLAEYARVMLVPNQKIGHYHGKATRYLLNLPPGDVRDFASAAQRGIFDRQALGLTPHYRPGEEHGARGAVRPLDDDDEKKKKKPQQESTGQIVKRFHSGDIVDLTPKSNMLAPDEVPAILQKGEFVIRKSAVENLGVPFMKQLNRMHDGGEVFSREIQKLAEQRMLTPVEKGKGIDRDAMLALTRSFEAAVQRGTERALAKRPESSSSRRPVRLILEGGGSLNAFIEEVVSQ